MLKILIKKQLLEINRALFFDRKTGKRRSTAGIAFFVGLFVLLFVFLMAWFAFEAYFIGNVFISEGLNWLFFAATGIMGMFFGILGSVFNTYASLYIAKDNDLLLSMPIPVKSIILSRLASVYIIGAAYVLCSGMFGLFLNLKRPDFKWTSESAAIKHSFALIIDSIAGIIFAFAIAHIYLLCIKAISPFLFGVILVLILSVPIILLFLYFNKKAVNDFADL